MTILSTPQSSNRPRDLVAGANPQHPMPLTVGSTSILLVTVIIQGKFSVSVPNMPSDSMDRSTMALHPDSDRLSSINKMRSRIRQRTSLSSDSSFAALGSAGMPSPPDLNHTSSSISISLTAPQPVLHNNNSNHSTERASCNSQGTTSVSSRSHNYFTRSRSNISNKG